MIPVTVIGGYLGAGKTTLINRLLAGGHGRRLAVLVNDFGAVNIDVDLVVRHDGDTIALSNGCVCCSIADALGAALDKVVAMRPAPDNIVIEASGVADPGKVAYYGQGWPGVRLDTVITMVDGGAIRDQARDKFVGGLVLRQLAAGDLILLSKTDLMDLGDRLAVRQWLAVQAPTTRLVEASHGGVPADLLLEGDGRDIVPTNPSRSFHDNAFVSVLFEDSRPFDRSELLRQLADWPDAVLRAKGIVCLSDDSHHTYRLQRVGARGGLEVGPPWGSEPAISRLVLIGLRDELDADLLRRSLQRAIAAAC